MEDVDNYFCGDCEHFNNCKRIGGKPIKFAKPFFSCDDVQERRGTICAEFIPKRQKVEAIARWTSFDDYWAAYVEQWLPYKDTNKNVYFTLNGDTSIRYGVPLMDFVNGTMIVGDALMAVEKMYYRRSHSGFGYKLVREKIDGVKIT